MARLSPGMRQLAFWTAILVGGAYTYFAILSRFPFTFVGLVLIFLGIRRANPVNLSESSRRALRRGMIAVGAVLFAAGVVTLALLFTPARTFMPEAELFFEELGTFPPTPWGTFVWIAFWVGLPTGVLVLGLALTDHTHLLAYRRPSQH